MKKTIFLILGSLIFTTGGIPFFSSCCSSVIKTPEQDKLEAFHQKFFQADKSTLKADNLSLFVDYSTCISQGQYSDFYNELVPSFVDATKNFYSIKGDIIAKEEGDVFTLLRSIKEENYAELRKAVNSMADSESESVLMTDGEYYKNDVTKSSINNPYMADAFKKWLTKGSDIYIISEPYIEQSHGNSFNKKRFYILFTDSRLEGNIWSRIQQKAQLKKYPDVKVFHLSASHPTLYVEKGKKCSNVNPSLAASVKNGAGYEIQGWTVPWNLVEQAVVYGSDSITGEPLTSGDYICKGIKVDSNSLGGYKIKSAGVKSYLINEPYSTFYYYDQEITSADSLTQFNGIIIDEEKFSKDGDVELHFGPNYLPSIFNGEPYNYIKVDLYVTEVEDISSEFSSMFEFDSIEIPGRTNTSVVESIKQCLFTPEIKNLVLNKPIYTYYIQSSKY